MGWSMVASSLIVSVEEAAPQRAQIRDAKTKHGET
jgi:hypothetical protein